MTKLQINKLIVVEGKYDKIKLSNITDAKIFVVNGFGIFNDDKAKKTLRALAHDKDVLILTDSDTAGYKIRVFLTKILSGNNIINVFAPEIRGVERRKSRPSKSGVLGVEGMDDDTLINVLSEYADNQAPRDDIKLIHLYELGYTGLNGSKDKKNRLLEYLNVQKNISNKFLLRILNDKFTLEQFINLKIM